MKSVLNLSKLPTALENMKWNKYRVETHKMRLITKKNEQKSEQN